MTPAQVEEAARRRYNAVNANFWSQDEVFKVIYEGEMILAREANVIEAVDSSTTTTASTQSYALPTRFIAVKRLEVNGRKLKPINLREDDVITLNDSATTSTGTPQYYYIWNDTAYLRPIPDTSSQTIKFYGFKEPTLLTTASSSLSVPTRFHTDLIDYVASIMAAKDENLRMAQWYETRWAAAVEKAKAWNRRRLRADGYSNVQDEAQLAETILGSV